MKLITNKITYLTGDGRRFELFSKVELDENEKLLINKYELLEQGLSFHEEGPPKVYISVGDLINGISNSLLGYRNNLIWLDSFENEHMELYKNLERILKIASELEEK